MRAKYQSPGAVSARWGSLASMGRPLAVLPPATAHALDACDSDCEPPDMAFHKDFHWAATGVRPVIARPAPDNAPSTSLGEKVGELRGGTILPRARREGLHSPTPKPGWPV